MPNYCSNKISIKADEKTIREIADIFSSKEPLNAILPTPAGLLEQSSPIWAENDSKKSDIKASNFDLYGAEDWYMWRIQNWGTKWDIDVLDLLVSSENISFSFDSAWAPPLAAITELAKKFPNAEIEMNWHEPGCAFMGDAYWADGENEYIDERDMEKQDFINLGYEGYDEEDDDIEE